MNDLLNQLPEHDPRPDLWARIEADLRSDERLARAVGGLPTFEPRADLWDGIADPNPVSIGQNRTSVRDDIIRPLWVGLIAAAVVVLVGTWLFLRPEATETVRIEYAVETNRSMAAPDEAALTGVPVGDGPSSADQRAEAFIHQQCAQQTLACQRPEVHELRNQLTDLTAEQERIEQERQTFGNDPRLVRAQVQIENQRADVTKELITLLRS